MTGTLAIDGWAVTFGTARRGLDGYRYSIGIVGFNVPLDTI